MNNLTHWKSMNAPETGQDGELTESEADQISGGRFLV